MLFPQPQTLPQAPATKFKDRSEGADLKRREVRKIAIGLFFYSFSIIAPRQNLEKGKTVFVFKSEMQELLNRYLLNDFAYLDFLYFIGGGYEKYTVGFLSVG